VFADKALNGVADGALFGNPGQLLVQGTAILAAIVYSGVMSFILLKLVGLVLPLRVDASEEAEGCDVIAHGEEAYTHIGGTTPTVHAPTTPAATPVFSPARAQV
jgi:Amt family ammonium transporter